MEYDELYDESPYTSKGFKEVPRRGGTMPTIRATFLLCATILASVFAMLFYNYQQDQFVVSSNGAFVSIFDRQSKTINVCDKGNCNLLRPHFVSPHHVAPKVGPQGQIIPQMAGRHPQMMGQPPMGNPQMMPPQMGRPQMMPPQMGQPQMMGAQMGRPPMGNPQMMNPQMIRGAPGGAQPQMAGGAQAPAAADETAEDEAANAPEEEAAPI